MQAVVAILLIFGAVSYAVQVFILSHTYEICCERERKLEITYQELLVNGILCLTPVINVFQLLLFRSWYKQLFKNNYLITYKFKL